MCKVEGCKKNADRKGYCAVHYMRQWRNGTTSLTRTRKERLVHTQGYYIINRRGHPLADKQGSVYEHRHVYYEANGSGPFNCYWCDKQVDWSNLHIDHLNEDKQDNGIDNLNATCSHCNTNRGDKKRRDTWARKSGLIYKGEPMTGLDLSVMAGISRQAFMERLKTMSVEEAVAKPRGKTGPKPCNLAQGTNKRLKTGYNTL